MKKRPAILIERTLADTSGRELLGFVISRSSVQVRIVPFRALWLRRTRFAACSKSGAGPRPQFDQQRFLLAVVAWVKGCAFSSRELLDHAVVDAELRAVLGCLTVRQLRRLGQSAGRAPRRRLKCVAR